MSAYLSPREHQLSAKHLCSILHQPFGRIIAILSAGRPWVFRRKSVPDREDRQLVVIGHVFEVCVLAIPIS